MGLNPKYLQKPFEKVAKAAKASPKLVDPEYVHKLRTNSRRVEAVLSAVDVMKPGSRRALLKSLAKVRRAAGDVRDMDVLTAKTASLSIPEERNCQVRLLEHLGTGRKKQYRRLVQELKRQGRGIRKALKRCAEKLQGYLAHTSDSNQQQKAEARATARALELSAELQRFASLRRGNLHEFRKQAKQLRYVLQLAIPPDEELVARLTKLQDAIGEWHDWEQLAGIAKETLNHGPSCALLRELQRRAEESFGEGLKIASEVRKRVLEPGKQGGRKRPSLRIVRAAAAIAA